MFQSPLDYVFQNIADIYPSGLSAMSPIWTTKGNVAHAVIQSIFWDKMRRVDIQTVSKES